NEPTDGGDLAEQVLESAYDQSALLLPKDRTLLLVVDLVNDGEREEGFLKQILGEDISYRQRMEPPTVELVDRAKLAGVTTCFVQPVYDFSYLYPAMRKQFERQGIPDVVYKKGTWGTQFVDSLPKPDLHLVKSNFSVFSRHSF